MGNRRRELTQGGKALLAQQLTGHALFLARIVAKDAKRGGEVAEAHR